jgi:hypothetical protein
MNPKFLLFPSIFTILLLMICSISEAQTCPPDYSAFSGVIFDAETGQPIVGALVCLYGIDNGTNYTDSEGKYFVSNIYQSENMISVRSNGYLNYDQTISDLKQGQTQTMYVALYKESTFNPNATGESIISGTIFDKGTMEPLGESSVIVSVFGFEIIENEPYQKRLYMNTTKTDSNGNYEIILKPGFYTIIYYKQHPEKDCSYSTYRLSRYFADGEHFEQNAYLTGGPTIAGGSGSGDSADGDASGDDGQHIIPGFGAFEASIVMMLARLAIKRRKF